MSEQIDPSLYEAALARYLDGEPEPGDGELLAAALRASPERARELAGLAAIDDMLRQSTEPAAGGFVEALSERIEARRRASAEPFVRQVERRIRARQSAARLRLWFPWLVAAAACVVAAVGWLRPGRSPIALAPGGHTLAVTGPATRPSASEPLALMVNQAGAAFAKGEGPDAVSFGRGTYDLVRGAAHLRFRNGTDVVLVAPTRFAIDDALHVRLDEGKLRALVPVSAHGFTVSAPGANFRDMGTEFGVLVARGKSPELHVFDGQVQVLRPGDPHPEKTVLGGAAVRVDEHGVPQPEGPAREAEFPSASSISITRWLAWRDELRRDPHLVIFYPFIENAKNPSVLTNDAPAGGPAVAGRIEGAEWVTGRWPGKRALQFEHTGDDVRLTLPGEFNQITLAAWLKVDRVENAEHTILSSVGWQAGGLQWQFNRHRQVESTSVFSNPKRYVLSNTALLPLGQWVHWAVTIDRSSGRILHYLNGKFVCEARIAPGTLIAPGPAAIGRWINDGPAPQVREFRGRIDELAIWRTVLSPARIAEMADAGMPIELPDPDQTGSAP